MIKLNPCGVCGNIPVMEKINGFEVPCGSWACPVCGYSRKINQEQTSAAWNAANPKEGTSDDRP